MEAVNLAVGILAIVVSLGAIFVSVIYSVRASNTMHMIDERAKAIEENVGKRLDDLIKRAAPSPEEKVMTETMGEFFKAALSDPSTVSLLLKESFKQQRK